MIRTLSVVVGSFLFFGAIEAKKKDVLAINTRVAGLPNGQSSADSTPSSTPESTPTLETPRDPEPPVVITRFDKVKMAFWANPIPAMTVLMPFVVVPLYRMIASYVKKENNDDKHKENQ